MQRLNHACPPLPVRAHCFADGNSWFAPQSTITVRGCPDHMRAPMLYLLAHSYATLLHACSDPSHAYFEFRDIRALAETPPECAHTAADRAPGWTYRPAWSVDEPDYLYESVRLRLLWTDIPWSRELYQRLCRRYPVRCWEERLPYTLLVYFRSSSSSSSDADHHRLTTLDFTYPSSETKSGRGVGVGVGVGGRQYL